MRPSRTVLRGEPLEARLPLTVEMVADFNDAPLGFEPSHFTHFQDELYFTVNAGEIRNAELWKTDGTADGTELVTQIAQDAPAQITHLEVLGEELAIFVWDLAERVSMYASDGTEQGTRHVFSGRDVGLGEPGFFQGFERAGEHLYFGIHGIYGPTEFAMSTDGTRGGTHVISRKYGLFGGRTHSIARGETLYFAGRHRDHGTGLWFTDGTADGTRLVRSINPDRNSSSPEDFAFLDDQLFFSAETRQQGRELWTSDGTAEGTRLVDDLFRGDDSSDPRHITPHNGSVFFLATNRGTGRQVWQLKSADGTPQPVSAFEDAVPTALHVVDGTLVTMVEPVGGGHTDVWSLQATELQELGSIDGVVSNVLAAHDRLYVASDTGSVATVSGSAVESLRVLDADAVTLLNATGQLVFFTAESETGTELWQTDGSADATVLVRAAGPELEEYAVLGDQLLFGGTDQGAPALFGVRDAEPQVLEVDAPARTGSITVHSAENLNQLAVISIEHKLNAVTPMYSEWWAYVATAEANGFRTLVEDPLRWSTAFEPTPNFYHVEDAYYFQAMGQGIWQTDLRQPGERVDISALKAIDDRFEQDCCFLDGPSEYRAIPWRDGVFFFNGSWSRTYVVADTTYIGSRNELYQQPADGSAPEFIQLPGRLGRFGDRQIPGQRHFSPHLVAHDDTLYFELEREATGVELWESDGTSEGTTLVADLNPGEASTSFSYLGRIGDDSFFIMRAGQGLQVMSVRPGHAPVLGATFASVKQPLGVIDDAAYFIADDGEHGHEVWRVFADHRAEQLEIHPGERGFGLRPLTVGRVDDAFYFAADDGIHGSELWRADAGGVALVDDIWAGPLGSNPEILVELADALILTADDGEHGRELWRVVAPLDGDVDGNGTVEFKDFLILASNYGRQDAQRSQGDLNEDGKINFTDYLLLAVNFGRSR